MTEIVIHEALCAVLLYSVFCRAVRSSDLVRTDVRLAFFFLGMVACVGIVAPLVWKFAPDCFTIALLASISGVQLVTAHHWEQGVPDRFLKPMARGFHRRATDRLEGDAP